MIEAAGSSDILIVDFLDCDLEFASAKVPYCQLDKITIYDGQLLLQIFTKFIFQISIFFLQVLILYSVYTARLGQVFHLPDLPCNPVLPATCTEKETSE